MKLLVFGKTGQVATELQRQGDVIALGRDQADLSNPAACAAVIENSDADVVINAAAYTAVDKAESEANLAHLVNGAAPTAMAQACAAKGVPFLHVSTDYVFNGQGETPWSPLDATGPLGVYGASKLAGEVGVRAAQGPHAILRTSWVFSAHGNNFVKTMLRLGADRDALSVVNDQIGGPTAAADIAAALLVMAKAFYNGQGTTGIYHFAGGPDVSWADFAAEIFKQANLTVELSGIPTSAYPTPATRPPNSRMNCSNLDIKFDIKRPDWLASLKAVLKDLNHA